MVSPSLSVRPALRTWFVCGVLFAGSVLLFSRAADYGFSNYDDPTYVTNNPHVQAGLTWPGIVWAFTAPADYWHPLTWLSHMLDCELFGGDAYGHHLTSLLWHASNAVLAFFVFRRLTGAYWTSAFAAALFAWHPLRVESVVWITERKDVMSGFFFLLTLLAYTRYAKLKSARSLPRGSLREQPDIPAARSSATPIVARPAVFYALTLASFIAGLMSKPMLVTLPVVLLILDFWPLQRLAAAPSLWQRWRGLLLEKLPFFLLSAIASVATVWMQRNIGAFTLELPLAARIANAFVSIARYLGKFFYPVDLTVFYPHPGSWPLLITIAAVALTVALTFVAWRQRHARPWIITGWLCFLVTLSPAIGVIQVGAQSMADRYTYLPILGIQLALLWTLREGAQRIVMAPWIRSASAVVVLLACGARAWDQQATWRDPVALFQHSVAIEDRNEIGHALLAYTLLGENRADEAEHHARRALEFNPRNAAALFTIAEVRERQERFDEAESAYRAALAAKPNDARSAYQLGELLLRLGRTDEGVAQMADAIRGRADHYQIHLHRALAEARAGRAPEALVCYRVAIAANPADPDAHFGAGAALKKLGRDAEARTHFQAALTARPDFAPAHTELGLSLLASGDADAAALHLRAAVDHAPDFAVAHLGLGRAAEKLGRTAEATASFQHALRLTPNDPTTHRAWAEVLARRQQFADAIRHYERAAELDPNHAETHAALGYLLMFTGRRDEGTARWKRALALDPNFPGLRQRLEQLR